MNFLDISDVEISLRELTLWSKEIEGKYQNSRIGIVGGILFFLIERACEDYHWLGVSKDTLCNDYGFPKTVTQKTINQLIKLKIISYSSISKPYSGPLKQRIDCYSALHQPSIPILESNVAILGTREEIHERQKEEAPTL